MDGKESVQMNNGVSNSPTPFESSNLAVSARAARASGHSPVRSFVSRSFDGACCAVIVGGSASSRRHTGQRFE